MLHYGFLKRKWNEALGSISTLVVLKSADGRAFVAYPGGEVRPVDPKTALTMGWVFEPFINPAIAPTAIKTERAWWRKLCS